MEKEIHNSFQAFYLLLNTETLSGLVLPQAEFLGTTGDPFVSVCLLNRRLLNYFSTSGDGSTDNYRKCRLLCDSVKDSQLILTMSQCKLSLKDT